MGFQQLKLSVLCGLGFPLSAGRKSQHQGAALELGQRAQDLPDQYRGWGGVRELVRMAGRNDGVARFSQLFVGYLLHLNLKPS